MHHYLILNAIRQGVRRWELLENTRYFSSSGYFCILHSCEFLFTEEPVKQDFQKQSIPFFNSHHLYGILEVRKLEAYWIERILSSFLFISPTIFYRCAGKWWTFQSCPCITARFVTELRENGTAYRDLGFLLAPKIVNFTLPGKKLRMWWLYEIFVPC